MRKEKPKKKDAVKKQYTRPRLEKRQRLVEITEGGQVEGVTP